MIGVITTSYPRGPQDWAGGFVRERVRLLRAAGHAVEVIAAGDPTRSGPDEPGVTRVGGGGLFYGAGAPEVLERGGAAWLQGLAFSARLAELAAARLSHWTALESHWLIPSALIGCAIAGARPHRAYAHGGDVALLERLPGGPSLARVLARSGASFIFASAELRARFARLAGVDPPAQVEPAPFESAAFVARTPERRRLMRQRLGCSGPTLLGVGRLVPVKGWDILLRAVLRLPRAGRPRIVLLGDGPERLALAARAARSNLDLHLPGAVERATVADWLAAADLYAQPSVLLPNGRGEGTPLAVREALAVGVPVIASAVGGLGELAHPALTLIPPARPDLLARAIAQLL
jgi:glycosyltransferase involved in cell wall biosynthesis